MTDRRLFSWVHDERGTTLVEFALVAPVVLLVLIVCFDFARAVNAYVTISSASREGARYASVLPASVLQDPSKAKAAVYKFLRGRIAPLDPDPEVFQVTAQYTPTTDSRWNPAAPVPGTVTIGVTYDWRAATWIAGSFFPAATRSRTFEATTSFEATASMETMQ